MRTTIITALFIGTLGACLFGQSLASNQVSHAKQHLIIWDISDRESKADSWWLKNIANNTTLRIYPACSGHSTQNNLRTCEVRLPAHIHRMNVQLIRRDVRTGLASVAVNPSTIWIP
jgi:hypothetical protein